MYYSINSSKVVCHTAPAQLCGVGRPGGKPRQVGQNSACEVNRTIRSVYITRRPVKHSDVAVLLIQYLASWGTCIGCP